METRTRGKRRRRELELELEMEEEGELELKMVEEVVQEPREEKGSSETNTDTFLFDQKRAGQAWSCQNHKGSKSYLLSPFPGCLKKAGPSHGVQHVLGRDRSWDPELIGPSGSKTPGQKRRGRGGRERMEEKWALTNTFSLLPVTTIAHKSNYGREQRHRRVAGVGRRHKALAIDRRNGASNQQWGLESAGDWWPLVALANGLISDGARKEGRKDMVGRTPAAPQTVQELDAAKEVRKQAHAALGSRGRDRVVKFCQELENPVRFLIGALEVGEKGAFLKISGQNFQRKRTMQDGLLDDGGITEKDMDRAGKEELEGDDWEIIRARGGCGGFCWISLGFENDGVAVEGNRWHHWNKEKKLGVGAHQSQSDWSKTT
ncbi:hypothetical protein PPACK8108_LOCUS16358 [Phakopsora pachyrhizi]|uniref:Uncharacterized protein n=1 Tax=Phakopsora pachyrhizi TaxID=170000 RepID=A0AAV0B7Z6_PHAPC|nr:hypothetical protein PPACK8108_LOCUS16358 [Phakopsora pachyrhizi]